MDLSYTRKQGQVLAFIHAFGKLTGHAPREVDIQRFFAVSQPAANQMLRGLERSGFISRAAGHARPIRLLISPRTLPVLAELAPPQTPPMSPDKAKRPRPEAAACLVDPGKLLTFQQASSESGYTARNLRLLAIKGRLKAWLLAGGVWVTTEEHLVDYLRNDPDRRKPRREA